MGLPHTKVILELINIFCTLAKHTVEADHKFAFDYIKIIDLEKKIQKRLFLEITHIHTNQNWINFWRDIGNLSLIYTYLLNLNENNTFLCTINALTAVWVHSKIERHLTIFLSDNLLLQINFKWNRTLRRIMLLSK